MSQISFPVIAHDTEQHCGFGSALPSEELHITLGGNLPQFGNHWYKRNVLRWKARQKQQPVSRTIPAKTSI